MKFRFLSKWSIILSIFINLLSIQVSSVNQRSNTTLQTENLQAELDFDDNINDEAQQIGVTNDYEDTTDAVKGYSSLQNKEKRSDNSSLYSRKHNNRIVKRAADLELAEFELEKVEKNVEKEIINLKKRYNNKENNHKRGINRNHENPSAPRLMKIRVETYEIGNEPVADQSKSNKRRDRSSSLVMTNVTPRSTIKKTTTHRKDIEQKNKTRILIENAIQKKIDAIKNKVKRLIANEQKHNNIRRNNAKFNELRKIRNIAIRSLNRKKSPKSSKNTASNLKKKSISRRSALKNQQQKSITKRIVNHHDAKRMIRRPERTPVTSKIVSSVDLDPQMRSTSSKSEGPGSRRLTRRLRKPPDDSKQLHRSTRRLRKPSDNSPNLQRSSRRLRKPPHNLEKHLRPLRRLRKPSESQVKLTEKVQTNKKSRHVMNAQNITTNPNFLFHEVPYRKKPVIRSDQERQFSPPKQKLEGRSKHKRAERKTNRRINNDNFGQRKERAVGTLLDPTNSDQVAGSISQNMVNSHDINSHLVSEYSDTFGGFPSDSDDTSLLRYKRVKRS